jgi:Uma2 family endonuclease
MSAMTTLPVKLDGWTVDDLFELPEDDQLHYELVDGALLMAPAPELRHDHLATELGYLLRGGLDPQWRAVVGGGVRFDDRNYRQPDVLVVASDALGKKLADPADVLLLVEVMSPSSISSDRISKPAQYATAGIPYYWRLERQDTPVLFTYALEGEVYREVGRFVDEVAIQAPVALTFSLSELLD